MKAVTEINDIRLIQDIHYTIKYSYRRTISIVVIPEKGVTVRAPFRTSKRTIEKFVNEKSLWIIRCLENFKSLQKIDNRNGYSDGDQVMLYGDFYRLRLISSDRFNVRLKDNKTIELEFNQNNDPLLIKELLDQWFRFIATRELTSRFRELLAKYDKYGFKPTGFSVRKMKKRWGSCSSRGRIGISYDLIRLNKKFSDYVIAHELCHLRHHDHSANYYRLLSEVYPEWRKVREELKEYLR